MPELRILLPLLPLAVVGCEAIEGLDPDPTGRDLRQFTHSCPGSRTDTLQVDDNGQIWIGCGEASDGLGLYRSDDDGASWRSVAGFESFRVSDLSRPSDGKLYVAGRDVENSDRIRSLDGTTVETVLVGTNQLWNTFHVGTFVRQDSGLAIAESLTGTDMAFRPDDTTPWGNASPWVSGSYQMLDLVDDGGTLIGVGSTISQPHTVFVQDTGSSFTAVTLDTSFDGELWAVDADDGLYAAAGVDQDGDEGVVYTNDGDPRDPEAWQAYRHVADDPTWFRDVCRSGSTVLAVGSYSRGEDGLALISRDGGASFEIYPLPEGTPTLYNCWLDERALFLAGGQGFFAVAL